MKVLTFNLALMTTQLVEISTGYKLELNILEPPGSKSHDIGKRLAICLHPWSVLGGRMNDP